MDRQICTPAHRIALSGYLQLFKNSFPQIIFLEKKNISSKKKNKKKKNTRKRNANTDIPADLRGIRKRPKLAGSRTLGVHLSERFKLVRVFLPTRNNGGCFKHYACTYVQRGLMMFFPSRPATPTRLTFRCHPTPSPRQRERLEKREILIAGTKSPRTSLRVKECYKHSYFLTRCTQISISSVWISHEITLTHGHCVKTRGRVQPSTHPLGRCTHFQVFVSRRYKHFKRSCVYGTNKRCEIVTDIGVERSFPYEKYILVTGVGLPRDTLTLIKAKCSKTTNMYTYIYIYVHIYIYKLTIKK